MSFTDLQICDYLIRLYAWQGEPGVWDYADLGQGANGICWAVKGDADEDLVLFRGSVTLLDWLRDFYAVPLPFAHPAFGDVHPGFYIGMPEVWRQIRAITRPQRNIAGHSLGGGRACMCTALAIQDGEPPIRRVVFGCPKPGYSAFARFIDSVPAASYRNGDAKSIDEVTAVPLTLPIFPYRHPGGLVDVSAPPAPDLSPDWGPLNWHHLPLYRQGLANAGIQ